MALSKARSRTLRPRKVCFGPCSAKVQMRRQGAGFYSRYVRMVTPAYSIYYSRRTTHDRIDLGRRPISHLPVNTIAPS